jgi:hypothetical protein
MVAEPARLDDDDVDPEGQQRYGQPIGQHPPLNESECRPAQLAPLPMIHRLLHQPEVPGTSPAHLDDHESRRRMRIHGDQIKLRPPDSDIPGQDPPSEPCEPLRHQRFDGITGLLLSCPHEGIIATAGLPRLIRRSPARYVALRAVARSRSG